MAKSAITEKESPSRTIILSADVDEISVGDIMEKISEINEIDDENEETINNYERKPIKLIVNSFGGSIYDGLGLIGFIENSVTPVYTYCYGSAMSMGFMILISGHQRFMHRLSTCMYHEGSDYNFGEKITTISENLEEVKRIMKICDDYIIGKTGLKKRQLDEIKRTKKDWYFSAEEAHAYGIIDQIV